MNKIKLTGIPSLNEKFLKFKKNNFKFDDELSQKLKERNLKIFKSIFKKEIDAFSKNR